MLGFIIKYEAWNKIGIHDLKSIECHREIIYLLELPVLLLGSETIFTVLSLERLREFYHR